ncbi:unnamed protein product, partial [Tetraodon nigroviridis]
TTKKILTMSNLTLLNTLKSSTSGFCCTDQLVLASPASSTLLTLFYMVNSGAEFSQMEIWLKAASPRYTKTSDLPKSQIETAVIASLSMTSPALRTVKEFMLTTSSWPLKDT